MKGTNETQSKAADSLAQGPVVLHQAVRAKGVVLTMRTINVSRVAVALLLASLALALTMAFWSY